MDATGVICGRGPGARQRLCGDSLLLVEVLPGVGVAAVRVGDSRSEVEQRIGQPSASHGNRAVYDTPGVVLDYDQADRVELVQVPYSGTGEEATLDGIQLTYRFMEDVVADLSGRGYAGRPSDIGYEFQAGFAIFSMSSLHAQALDPSAPEEDERSVVEGVAIAPWMLQGPG